MQKQKTGTYYNMARKKLTPKYEEVEETQSDVFIEFKKGIKLTSKQRVVVDLINENKVTVVTGVAGTAKTFSAIYAALKLFTSSPDYHRIIITKPTEIIGDTGLGYTPGTLEEKLGVYMENFNDVFEDIVTYDSIQQMITGRELQYKASQFMRGRTFKNSIVIVDEFQSFDIHTLMALVTRIGKAHCKVIFCGDVKQNDINKKYVAVNLFKEILKDVQGATQFEFAEEDNMRDPMIIQILKNFDKLEAEGKITPNKKNA